MMAPKLNAGPTRTVFVCVEYRGKRFWQQPSQLGRGGTRLGWILGAVARDYPVGSRLGVVMAAVAEDKAS